MPHGGPWGAQAPHSLQPNEPLMGDVWCPVSPVLLRLLGRLGVRTWQGRVVSLLERAPRRPCPLGGNHVCPVSTGAARHPAEALLHLARQEHR